MNRRLTVALGAALLAIFFGAFFLPGLLGAWIAAARSGPVHAYQLDRSPEFLTEELALQKAAESMKADGFGESTWAPADEDRSVAPDGRQDKHLLRNTIDPNKGSVMYWNRELGRRLIVRVELNGDQITCQHWLPK